MGTNKTRLSVIDFAGALPFGFTGVTEFDIYHEAYDYAETTMKFMAADLANYTFFILLLSYDNPSYKFYIVDNAVVITEISFPS